MTPSLFGFVVLTIVVVAVIIAFVIQHDWKVVYMRQAKRLEDELETERAKAGRAKLISDQLKPGDKIFVYSYIREGCWRYLLIRDPVKRGLYMFLALPNELVIRCYVSTSTDGILMGTYQYVIVETHSDKKMAEFFLVHKGEGDTVAPAPEPTPVRHEGSGLMDLTRESGPDMSLEDVLGPLNPPATSGFGPELKYHDDEQGATKVA